MKRLNVEIKARCMFPEKIHQILETQQAYFRGVDHQIDTYFHVPHGRLKLREGKIENHLIQYFRQDQAGPKKSEVLLYKTRPKSDLKDILITALGVRAVVDKYRHIYYMDNVKFHVDEVKGLGDFVEIEAIDADGKIGEDKLREQCDYYLRLLGIDKEDLLEGSYSDMILDND
jgi:adenylate cyclase class 2